jgi:hypothetical protein
VNNETNEIPIYNFQTFPPSIGDNDRDSDDGVSKESGVFKPFKTSRVYKPMTSDISRIPLSPERSEKNM